MILVFGSQKGGTGKSTSSSNLATYLAHEGADVILLDADAQHTSSRWAARRAEENSDSPVVHSVQKSGCNMISTIRDLASRYEHVIVDTGGHDGVEFRSAVVMANRVVIPTRPSQADLETLSHVDEVIGQARALREDGGPDALVVLSMVSSHHLNKERDEAASFVEDHLSLRVSNARIHDRKVYRDAMLEGRGVIEMANEHARHEITHLAKEVFA